MSVGSQCRAMCRQPIRACIGLGALFLMFLVMAAISAVDQLVGLGYIVSDLLRGRRVMIGYGRTDWVRLAFWLALVAGALAVWYVIIRVAWSMLSSRPG